jgi:hypothetical protein
MANLNKQSVREEFDKIKASFEEQVKVGKGVNPLVAVSWALSGKVDL